MSLTNPFQRGIYVLFISLTLVFYLTHVKKQEEDWHVTIQMKNKNFSSIFEEVSPRLQDMNNITDVMDVLSEFFIFSNGLDEKYGLSTDETVEPIYILGLFELTTKLGRRNEGQSELRAAKMAVKHVNALKVLPGYKLVLLVNDTQCDPGVAIDRFFHAIYSNHTIAMLLGSICSNVSEALAHIVPYWNILQVSYGAKSPVLSDRRKFPLFFRTIAPDSSHNIAKVHFIKHFKWHVVATFSQSENAYLLPINHLITQLERENISCISTVTFSEDNYMEQLQVLKGLHIRIIIGSFSVKMAPLIFCAAYALNMYGHKYVWILEQHEEIWWRGAVAKCSSNELLKAVEGTIMVGDNQESYYDKSFFTKLQELQRENTLILHNDKSLTSYAKQSYDAIWAMSLTLKESKIRPTKDFQYKSGEIVSTFFETMRSLRFIGLSGPIRFEGPDRVGDININQIQGGASAQVALYDSIRDSTTFSCKNCKNIYWKNGQVPIAQRILKDVLVIVPKVLFYTVGGISLVGIICSLVFLYFNLKFRRMTTVKISSPNLNNLAVIGCTLVYLSVMLLGFHNISEEINTYFNELCWVKIYLLSAGFSLTFGSMFAKSYRVHRLFTYSIPNLVKDKLLRDQQLIGLIFIPLLIDTLIMGLWITIDPLKRHLHDLVLEDSDEDPGVVYQPQVELCLCHNTLGWHIALFGYKSIILIMGVYMAWKTRHVKVPALNESQYIGICIYSAVFSIAIVIVFSFMTKFFILSYLAKALSILTSTTITLMLMFLPKLKSVLGRTDTELTIMQSMGLKMQYNTRRFIWDDPKEMLSRLEIQNKVYRGQLEALDKEILRLDELLRKSTASSNKSSGHNVKSSPEIYFLNVPRASWPTGYNQTIKSFASENKLSNVKYLEKSNFLGKLKRILGSYTSLNNYSNLDERVADSRGNKFGNVMPRSNPEMFGRIIMSTGTDLSKIRSESYLANTH